MTFRELGLKEDFAARLEKAGISIPTPIQVEAFPLIVSGQSVLGFSKTGTGKTLAFLAPLVQRIFGGTAEEKSGVRLLELVPTRELASQVADEFKRLVGDTRRAIVVVGGESEDRQIQGARNADCLVATPGRLIDLLERRVVDLAPLEAIVMDEADRLLDMGFLPDIRRLMSFLPAKRQMLFFSATLHFGVDELSYEFGAECERIGKPAETVTVEGLDHRVAFVGDDEKFHALVHFLREQGDKRGIVFSNYRDKAHYLSDRLRRIGARTSCLTAQLSQPQRKRIMDDFKAGKIQVLLASDLAARGLDVEELDFVVNVDLPEDPPTYVHRVGRTARAGREGRALSFVGFEDAFRLERLESFLGKPIERQAFDPEQLTGPLPNFGPPLEREPRDGDRDESQDRPRGRERGSDRGYGGVRGDRSQRAGGPKSGPRMKEPRLREAPSVAPSPAKKPVAGASPSNQGANWGAEGSPGASQRPYLAPGPHSTRSKASGTSGAKAGLWRRFSSWIKSVWGSKGSGAGSPSPSDSTGSGKARSAAGGNTERSRSSAAVVRGAGDGRRRRRRRRGGSRPGTSSTPSS